MLNIEICDYFMWDYYVIDFNCWLIIYRATLVRNVDVAEKTQIAIYSWIEIKGDFVALK